MAGMWRKLSRALLALVVVATAVVVVSVAPAVEAEPLGTLRVTPGEADAEQRLRADGTAPPAVCNVSPATGLRLFWDGATLLANVADVGPDGAFTAAVTVPTGASAGEHVITSRCGSAAVGEDLASAGVRVRAAAMAAPATGSVQPPAESGLDPSTATVEPAFNAAGPQSPASVVGSRPIASRGESEPSTTGGVSPAGPAGSGSSIALGADRPTTVSEPSSATASVAPPGDPASSAGDAVPAAARRRAEERERHRRPIAAAALRRPGEVLANGKELALDALLGGIVLLLAFVASEMANAALAERYGSIGVLRLARKADVAVRSFLDRLPQQIEFVAFTLASVLLYLFLDPQLGWNQTSLLSAIALLFAVAVTTAAFTVPGYVAARRHGVTSRFNAFPAALAFGAVCVGISRLGHFLPGFMVGAIGDFDPEREIPARDDGRAVAAGAGSLLVIAIGSWLLWSLVDDVAQAASPSFGVRLVDSVLATTVFVALEWLVFGLLPLRFCDGARICAWSRRGWAAIYLPAIVLFAEVLWPQYGTLPAHVLLPITIASGVAIALWLYVRSRPTDDEEPLVEQDLLEQHLVIDLDAVSEDRDDEERAPLLVG